MIYLTSGLPGSGKTLHTVTQVQARAEKESRPVFYLGIPGVTLPWTELPDFKSWLDCPQNALIVIDECQQFLPAQARAKGVDVPPEVSGFSTHRHRGVDVYLISQDPMQFDHFVRRLVGVHMHCVRPFGLSYSTVWQFEAVQGFKASEASAGFYDKISTKSRFDFPTSSFGFYKSAEVHTHKRRLPWLKLAGVAAILVGLSVAGVVAYQTVKGFTKGAETASAKGSGSGGGGGGVGGFVAPLMGGKAAPATTKEYVMARVVRIEGMPESAPIFDDMQKVVAVPRLSACVKSSRGCDCYTQQGTPIAAVPAFVCESFVKVGSFDPYKSAAPPGQPVPVASPAHVVQAAAAPVAVHLPAAPVPVDSAAPSGGVSAKGGVVPAPAK